MRHKVTLLIYIYYKLGINSEKKFVLKIFKPRQINLININNRDLRTIGQNFILI